MTLEEVVIQQHEIIQQLNEINKKLYRYCYYMLAYGLLGGLIVSELI